MSPACLVAALGLIAVKAGIWSAMLLCGTVCLTLILVKERESLHTPVNLAVLSGLLAAVLTLEYSLFMPALMRRGEVNRPVAAELNFLVPDRETIYVLRPGCQSFLFYIREPVAYLTEPGQIDDRVRFLLVREEGYRQLKEDLNSAQRLSATLCDFTYTHRGSFRLVQLSPRVYGREVGQQ